MSTIPPSAGSVAGTAHPAHAGLPAVWGGSARRPARQWSAQQLGLWIGAHAGLVLAMRVVPLLATAHALATLAFGIASLQRRRPDRVVLTVVYILGWEVIWRGLRAGVFYEYGKYASSALLILAILRYGLAERMSKAPLIYFALLLPSIAVMGTFDRMAVSFNLSGPLALAVATAFFSAVTIDARLLRKILIALFGPITGLCFLATFSSLTAEAGEFYAHGKAGSAGIGPNQVSSILGLGALACILFVLLEQRSRNSRRLMILVAVWLLAQSALTLSRGGFWTSIGAIAAASFYLLRDRRSRFARFLRIAVVVALGLYFLFPFADSLTGGVLSERFQSFDPTGRDRLIEGDLLAFSENPVLGTGPGQARRYHALTFRLASAHTEYTRMLAEHGILGLVALLILFGMCLRRLLSRRPTFDKAVVASFTTWALLFMLHAATRLAAPGLLFGLAAARFQLDFRPRQWAAWRRARAMADLAALQRPPEPAAADRSATPEKPV